MLRLVPLALGLALSLACQPPVEENAPPGMNLIAPVDDLVVNEGDLVPITVELTDADGDEALTLTVTSDVDGPLLDLAATPGTISDDVGPLTPGHHVLSVTASDGKDDGVRTFEVPVRCNGAPTVPAVRLTPSVPGPNDDLVAELDGDPMDPEGAEVAISWTWTRNGEVFRTGNGGQSSVSAARTAPGEVWTIAFDVFEARNGGRKPGGISQLREASVTIANEAPVVASARMVPLSPHPAQGLRCEAVDATDADGDAITFSYVWEVDRGEGFTLSPTHATQVLPVSATEPGDTWRCTLTPSDPYVSGAAVSTAATVRDDDVVVGPATADTHLIGPHGLVAPVHVDALGIPTALALSSSTTATRFYDLSTVRSSTGSVGVDAASGSRTAGATPSCLVSVDDVEGDGVPDLLVCAPDASEAWVTDLGGQPLPTGEAPWTADAAGLTTASFSSLGVAAVAGNITGNARLEVMVGVHDPLSADRVMLFGPGRFGAGEAVVTGDRFLRITSSFDDDRFGHALAMDGDITGDGIPDLVVGRRAGPTGTEAERRVAAYIYSGDGLARSTGNLEDFNAPLALAAPPDVGAGTVVGSVADLDGDGRQDPWMTAPDHADGRGVLWVFPSDVPVFTTQDVDEGDALLAISGEAAGDRFGARAGVLGDLDADGVPEWAIAAPGADDGAGRVYLFDGAAIAAATQGSGMLDASDADWTLHGDVDAALTLAGAPADLDGDGIVDLAVADASGVFIWWSAQAAP